MLLREPYTFFIDQSLGGKLIRAALADIGVKALILPEVFPQNVEDVEWLERAGTEKWVVLTKDKNIKRNELEREAVLNAEVVFIHVATGKMKGEQVALTVVAAMPRIKRMLAVHEPPVLARVSNGGVLWVTHDSAGVALEKPVRIK